MAILRAPERGVGLAAVAVRAHAELVRVRVDALRAGRRFGVGRPFRRQWAWSEVRTGRKPNAFF